MPSPGPPDAALDFSEALTQSRKSNKRHGYLLPAGPLPYLPLLYFLTSPTFPCLSPVLPLLPSYALPPAFRLPALSYLSSLPAPPLPVSCACWLRAARAGCEPYARDAASMPMAQQAAASGMGSRPAAASGGCLLLTDGLAGWLLAGWLAAVGCWPAADWLLHCFCWCLCWRFCWCFCCCCCCCCCCR